ncbi:hypothetical protein [Crateriforma spongiae]|uniref:hypothetical protein n=1 Tax=Crateriforma spongiae TaxID=2724528 RepID=UPI00197F859C|nr:hypothetical protein [Crateriforma spongiae]
MFRPSVMVIFMIIVLIMLVAILMLIVLTVVVVLVVLVVVVVVVVIMVLVFTMLMFKSQQPLLLAIRPQAFPRVFTDLAQPNHFVDPRGVPLLGPTIDRRSNRLA